MPTFSYPFGDDEATGFFGGYRRPTHSFLDPAGDDNFVPVNDTAPALSGGAADVLAYPSGEPVMDFNTGRPYPRPGRLNMQNNISAGQMINRLTDNPDLGDLSNPDLMFAPLFVHGSVMDYQRPLGHPFGNFDGTQTNISAYNFGVVGAAAGYDLDRLLKGAGSYNLWFGKPENAATSYGLSKERALSIRQGYDDYKTGRWDPGEAADPPNPGEP